jgi:outer membrane protein assembly factor BamB
VVLSTAEDVAPPELQGKAWTGQAPDGGWIVGIVGSRDRLIIPDASYPLVTLDDTTIVVTLENADKTRVQGIDPNSGRERWTATVVGQRFLGSASMKTLVLGGVAEAADPGLVAIDIGSGEVRELIATQSSPPGGTSWTRSALLTPDGTKVVTGLCDVQGSCASTTIDVTSGEALGSLEGLVEVVLVSDAVGVANDGHTVSAFDLTTGEALWERGADVLAGGYVASDGTMIGCWITADNVRVFAIERTDLLTGASTRILERPASEDWTLWPELSTEGLASIGHGGRVHELALAGQPIVGSTVDLASGAMEEESIRLADTEFRP